MKWVYFFCFDRMKLYDNWFIVCIIIVIKIFGSIFGVEGWGRWGVLKNN